jgi:hypothetical protein
VLSSILEEQEGNIIGHLVYVRSKKNTALDKGWWPQKKRLEVVTTWLALGSLAETSRICNVPLDTCNRWKASDWWAKLVQDIQSGEGQKTDAKMTKVIDKALDLIVSRIEEGDYQFDQKTGKIIKIPLKVRDLERVASGLFDKRQLIRKQPTSIKSSDLNQLERLSNLAKQFAEFASNKPRQEKIVDTYFDGEFDTIKETGHGKKEIIVKEEEVLDDRETN